MTISVSVNSLSISIRNFILSPFCIYYTKGQKTLQGKKASGINLMDYTKESGRIIKASAFTLHTKKASSHTDFLNSPSISGGTSADMTAFKAGAVDGVKQHSPWMFSAPFKSNHSHAGVEAYGGKMYAREMETLWNPYSVKHLVGSGGTDKLNPLMMFWYVFIAIRPQGRTALRCCSLGYQYQWWYALRPTFH